MYAIKLRIRKNKIIYQIQKKIRNILINNHHRLADKIIENKVFMRLISN